ncbi:MAG: AAA family ATPase, partial [Bacteroidota bacterium]
MEDLREKIIRDILGRDDIELSGDQEDALRDFLFFFNSNEDRSTFLLTGSAGTGKTFLINIFSEFMRKMGFKVILLAPTGRAAKVISRRTKRLAYTIHHHIYSPKENAMGNLYFSLKENKAPNRTVYIVDEASMIGDQGDETSPNSLLRDLLSFVFQGDESRKLILVGDPVQLPPVGHKESPGLDPKS